MAGTVFVACKALVDHVVDGITVYDGRNTYERSHEPPKETRLDIGRWWH